jgi:hypothetical protein
MAFFKKVSSVFKRSVGVNSNEPQVDAMSAGLGLNAKTLSLLEEQEENKETRADIRANESKVDESVLQEREAQRKKERQEARLVNRFMSRTLTGGSSDTASSAGSDSVTSSKYSGMSDGEILEDLDLKDDLLTGEIQEDKYLRRALDQLTERLRNDVQDVEICLMEEIHTVDTARTVVNKHLLSRVLSHYDDFMRGMDHVSEVDLDLTRACIHARNARRTLAKARQSMVVSMLDIARKKRKRKRLSTIQKLTRFMKTMSTKSYDVQKLIREEDYLKAITMLHDAEEALNGKMASQLVCLTSLRPQLKDMWPYLRRKIDSSLKEIIRKDVVVCGGSGGSGGGGGGGGGGGVTFDSEKYRYIMTAYMKLDITITRSNHSNENGNNGSRLIRIDSSAVNDFNNIMSVGGQHAYMSQYAGMGPLESEGGIEGTPERLQRIYLSLVEDCIRSLIDKRNRKKEGEKKNIGDGNPFCNDDNSKNISENSEDDDRGRPMTPSRRVRSSSSVIEQAQISYREQCDNLTPDDVVSLMFEIYSSLFNLMKHHCMLIQWHEKQKGNNGGSDDDGEPSLEDIMNDSILINGLKSTTPILWKCCCDRVIQFIKNVRLNFPTFRLHHATQVYNVTVLFVSQENVFHNGEMYGSSGGSSSSSSHPISDTGGGAQFLDDNDNRFPQETKTTTHATHATTTGNRLENSPLVRAVQQRIIVYLNSFQKDAYEVLSDFIQRETWNRLDMSLEDMGGVDGLVGRRQHVSALIRSSKMVRRLSVDSKCSGDGSGSSNGNVKILVNPFDILLHDPKSPIETKKEENDDIKDNEEEEYEFTPLTSLERVITTSALNGFTKYIGDYLNIMEYLPSMSSIAARGLFQLFEFYVNAVVHTFTHKDDLNDLLSDRDSEDITTAAWTYPMLAQLIRRVGGGSSSGGGNGDGGDEADNNLSTLTCATESVRFLLEMCQALRSNIQQKLGNAAHSSSTRAMFDDAEEVTKELRNFMYTTWTKKIIPKTIVMDAMKTTKWDPRDLPETFSPYVTIVTKHLFTSNDNMRIEAPVHVHSLLWKHMVNRLMLCLLDSYSNIKKCTNNGRAQMSLDLATLQRSIDQKVPNAGVMNCNGAIISNMFIKAYYYDSANDFISWLETPEQNMWGLSLRHILSLIGCDKSPLSKLKRKQKSELKSKVISSWSQFVNNKMESIENKPPPPPPPRPNGI